MSYKSNLKASEAYAEALGTPSEYQECQKFWQYCQLVPILADYMYKIPNEGKRSYMAGKGLKSIGLRAGLPDYHLPVSNAKFGGLWLEMKRQDQRPKKKRPEQDIWLCKLSAIGHYACYTYGADEAIDIVQKYLGDKLC